MNLGQELLREHSRRNMEKIASWACRTPGRVKQLMEIFLTGERVAAQRAAMAVGIVGDREPGRLRPYLARMVARMAEEEIHDAVRRCIVRYLQCADIPRGLQGRVATTCFDLLEDPCTPVAIKACSMVVLQRIAAQEPDLLEELKQVVEHQLPLSSPAFRVHARRILRQALPAR